MKSEISYLDFRYIETTSILVKILNLLRNCSDEINDCTLSLFILHTQWVTLFNGNKSTFADGSRHVVKRKTFASTS